ncbi:hypothetical protein FOCC_FOCC012829 [Frankliniella occidentalis]|nr:hypothetical protein FOCC_FOCC012829 [Frankliniella occidentalis]
MAPNDIAIACFVSSLLAASKPVIPNLITSYRAFFKNLCCSSFSLLGMGSGNLFFFFTGALADSFFSFLLWLLKTTSSNSAGLLWRERDDFVTMNPELILLWSLGNK